MNAAISLILGGLAILDLSVGDFDNSSKIPGRGLPYFYNHE
jgi:hypothetical protein